jgi:hypothetical protein
LLLCSPSPLLPYSLTFLRREPVKNILLHRPAAQDVFFVNPFQPGLVDLVIPDTFGINGQDGAKAADAQAVGQAAFDPLRVTQLVQTMFPVQGQKAEL